MKLLKVISFLLLPLSIVLLSCVDIRIAMGVVGFYAWVYLQEYIRKNEKN